MNVNRNSDDNVYSARWELRVRDLENAVADLTAELKALSHLASSERALAELRDRHEQLAARVRTLEQSAGE